MVAKSTTRTTLEKLNQQFLQQHHQKSLSALKKIKHVIVFKQGELALWKKDQTEWKLSSARSVNHNGDAYDTLKTTSHLPFLIKDILSSDSLENMTLLNEKKTVLEKLRHDLLTLTHETKDMPADSTLITEQSIEYISSLLHINDDSLNLQKSVRDYIARLRPHLENNAKEATLLQMKSLNSIMQEWIKKKSVDLLAARVVILGTHGPRKGLIEKEYFNRLYRERAGLADAENLHVYYAETLPKHIDHIDIKHDVIEKLLGTAEQNKSYGMIYNNDSRMMFSDILAKHAPLVLTGLFRKKAVCPITYMKDAVAKLKL